jgi:uncharacterized protein YigA (DUF484 family)
MLVLMREMMCTMMMVIVDGRWGRRVRAGKLTYQMGGGVSLKELTVKRGRLNHIKAELVVHKLVDDPQTNSNVFVNMKVNEMKKLLKEHELR